MGEKERDSSVIALIALKVGLSRFHSFSGRNYRMKRVGTIVHVRLNYQMKRVGTVVHMCLYIRFPPQVCR